MCLHYFILVCVRPMPQIYKKIKSNHEILCYPIQVYYILTKCSLIKQYTLTFNVIFLLLVSCANTQFIIQFNIECRQYDLHLHAINSNINGTHEHNQRISKLCTLCIAS